MKVVKFGGSSVADSEQFRKVKQIVESDSKRQVVVVSAAGKSSVETVKVTDMLLELEESLQNGMSGESYFDHISKRILKIKTDLKLTVDMESELLNIKQNLSDASHDYLISRGEYLTAKLMANYLGYHFVDAKDVLIFVNNKISYVESTKRLNKIYHEFKNIVIPGFYGSNVDGSIHLMPRGGSDITGSLLANLLNADLYENWTDVSGILMADPRIVNHSKKIDVLTYDELQELSYMGFEVFQEEAVLPVRQKQIPTEILNTNHPEDSGTLVVAKSEKELDNKIITGIAGKKNYTVITVKKYQLNKHIEVLQRVLSIFQKFNISINYIPSGNDAFSFLCRRSEISSKLNKIVSTLTADCGLDSVEVNKDIALVAAVSLQLSKRPAIAGKILSYLDNSLIKVNLVIQEGHDIKIVFGVSNDDYEKTIVKIYREVMFQDEKKISA